MRLFVKMSNIRIGVIGCGKISEKHLMGYKKIQDIEIFISDIDKNEARALSQDYEVNYVENPDNLIDSEEVDAVDVCVPTKHHAEVILKALEHEKHVFCEKPLTSSLKEAEEIEKRAEESDKVVMSGYLYRFHPAFEKIKEVLEEKIIGRPYYSIFRVGGRGSHRAWKHKEGEGGGAVNEMLVHMLNLIIWYFDGVKTAQNLSTETVLKTRIIDGREIEADAEDLTVLRFETEGGTKVLCESDLITPSYMNYVEIHGTNGSIWTSILDYFPTIVYCKEPRGVYNQGNNFFEYKRVDLFEKELRHFIETIQDGDKPSLNSIEESVETLKIINSLR